MLTEEEKKNFVRDVCNKVLDTLYYMEHFNYHEKHPHVNQKGLLKCALNRVVEKYFQLQSDEAKLLLEELNEKL